MRTNILTFPRWEKTSTGAGQPSAGHKQEGTGGEEDVETGDCRVWSETAKGEERICEGKSVSELSLIIIIIIIIIIDNFYRYGTIFELPHFNNINKLLCFFTCVTG